MSKTDDEIMKKGKELITKTFGYGKKGTHKKKCEICGSFFDEPNDLNVLVEKGPFKCPLCLNIEDLESFINSYEFEAMNIADKKNNLLINTHYNFGYSIDERPEEIAKHAEKLPVIWNQLTVDIDGNIEILESLHSGKYSFWDDGGNLKYYLDNSTLFFVVVRLVELTGKAKTIMNFINNNKKQLSSLPLYFVANDDDENILCKEPISVISIEKVSEKVVHIFNDLDTICNDLKYFRDKIIAHIDCNASNDYQKSLSIINIRRVKNALQTICKAFFLILAPHLYDLGFEIHGIDLDRMELISKRWHKSRQ